MYRRLISFISDIARMYPTKIRIRTIPSSSATTLALRIYFPIKSEIRNGTSINSATAMMTDNATVKPIIISSDLLPDVFFSCAPSSSS